jgi:hypothetical protein
MLTICLTRAGSCSSNSGSASKNRLISGRKGLPPSGRHHQGNSLRAAS